MNEFFTKRVDEYDQHMINNVDGCKEGYIKMAELLPKDVNEILDLGCGTGLELDEIFKVTPQVHVTGVDLTEAMLNKLKQKHPDKNLSLINASYFEYDFGSQKFDVVISFQTMHHFSHEDKIKLYSKIFDALKVNGVYIECDYMIESQDEEDFYYRENKRIRKENNIRENEFYHYDTPCTINNQIMMLDKAGFGDVEMNFRIGNTTIIVSKKL
jgi:SAM-dependent methyltransferase